MSLGVRYPGPQIPYLLVPDGAALSLIADLLLEIVDLSIGLSITLVLVSEPHAEHAKKYRERLEGGLNPTVPTYFPVQVSRTLTIPASA